MIDSDSFSKWVEKLARRKECSIGFEDK